MSNFGMKNIYIPLILFFKLMTLVHKNPFDRKAFADLNGFSDCPLYVQT
jgi:hypothetical protein